MPAPRWTERVSLAGRLTVLGLLAALLCSAAAGWWLRTELHGVVLRSLEGELADRAERIEAELVADGRLNDPNFSSQLLEFNAIFSGWYWTIEHQGRELRSRSLWDATLNLPRDTALAGRSGLLLQTRGPRQERLLGLERRVDALGEPTTLRVFGPMDQVLADLDRIDRVLLLAATLFLLAVAGTTWLQARLGLRPLQRLQTALASVREGRARAVAHGDAASYGPDLRPLVDTIDSVLDRNARVVERSRHQAADLSHALKKPLAVLSLELQSPACDTAVLRDQLGAMGRVIDRHLARFASGAGSVEVVNAAGALRQVVGLMQRLHAGRGLDWVVQAPEHLPWNGSPPDLEEMLGNLLDNAGKWARRQVVVQMQASSGGIELRIDDDGPGLPPAAREAAVQRGQRFDQQAEGHGLGLTIVSDIADTYGGSLTLETARAGGLCAVLRLP